MAQLNKGLAQPVIHGSVLQPWVTTISMMQQTVLLTAIRGPDGLPKYAAIKYLLRWYRRCILYSSMDHQIIDNPHDPRGGSFLGPSYASGATAWPGHMEPIVQSYLRELDTVPHHFHMHFIHAAEIVGYKHPNHEIAKWWEALYIRFVHDLHLHPETVAQLDYRLGDNEAQWRSVADKATQQ